MTDFFVEIGNAIKAARKEKKLTMQDLSQQVGLSQSAISMIENGVRQPSIQTLTKFSQALDVDFTKMILNATVTDKHNMASAHSDSFKLKTLDFEVDLHVSNFICEYDDPYIQKALYHALIQFLNNSFKDKYLQEQLDQLMKKTIKQALEEKQRELKKLYNRIQN